MRKRSLACGFLAAATALALVAWPALAGDRDRGIATGATVSGDRSSGGGIGTGAGGIGTGAVSAAAAGGQGKHRLGRGELTIARALARATAHSGHPLTLEQVIELRLKVGGWGEVFHRLKEEGLVDAKNLGQVVRRARATAGTTLVSTGSPTPLADATGRATGGDRARVDGQAGASGRADGGATGKARARAIARAEAREAAGHRFTEAPGHRSASGTRDVRSRPPEPASTRPLAITTANNRTDVARMGRPAGGGSARMAHSTGSRGGSAGRAPVTVAGHGRDGGPAVLITSAGNGSQAGGRAAVSSAGRGHGGHGHGRPQR